VKGKKAAAKPRAKKAGAARAGTQKAKGRSTSAAARARVEKYTQPGAPWWKVYLTGGNGSAGGRGR